jgi:protein-tyrosine-phosphatase
MSIEQRARIHRALGDEVRLRIVEQLILADQTPFELGQIVAIPSNLLAHHLGVLEDSGLLIRHRGEGDRRKRYVSLRHELFEDLVPTAPIDARSVLFVCTHNSARSQFAEAALRSRWDHAVQSAGTVPASRIHPKAAAAASEFGVEVSSARPKGYSEVDGSPDLVISVCDRAKEARDTFTGRRLHWSVPDPVEAGGIGDFRTAFSTINERVDRLVAALEGGTE